MNIKKILTQTFVGNELMSRCAQTPIGKIHIGDEPLAFRRAYSFWRLTWHRLGTESRTLAAHLHEVGEIAAGWRLVESNAELVERRTACIRDLNAQQRYARASISNGETNVRLGRLWFERNLANLHVDKRRAGARSRVSLSIDDAVVVAQTST